MFMICLVATGNEKDNFCNYLLTEPRVLFSLKYGRDISNVGISLVSEKDEEGAELESTVIGVSDFAIDFKNNIYIADKVNGRVKKFSMKGELIGATEDYLESIESVSVDLKGNIFVLYGDPSIHIAVYDNKGRRKKTEEEKIKKVLPGLTINYIRCDFQGNLYLFRRKYVDSDELYYKIEPFISKLETYKNRCPYTKGRSISLVPKSSKHIKVRIYRKSGEVDEYYTEGLQPIEVNVFNKTNGFQHKFDLPDREFSEAERLFPLLKVKYPSFDERGHLYFLKCTQDTKEISLSPVPSWNFYVWGPIAILEYDNNGRFVGIRALFYGAAFIPATNLLKVDSQGNIYYLDFKSDHVDVMMAPAPKKGAKRNK
ncbi:MAG: hypothetical protein NC906_08995 [Candidatus Omnitrophica bacterium]|nr:hypothetical protein [Candidatus Omnitrophota bacterium]